MRSYRRVQPLRVLSAALILLMALALLPVSAAAANEDGLLVERLTFRDVLRVYTLDKTAFGVDAEEKDASGVTNAAKRLAELCAYTVGLNYTGEGKNSNYFGKDITAKMDKDPYVEGNLLATYDVEILPYRSYALALADGKTTAIRVYRVGYNTVASGVEPILHYVWQDGGVWYALKDDNPYYKVSYNGQSAYQLQGSGVEMTRSRAVSGGTEKLQGWTSLTAAADGDGIVHVDGATLVAGQGTVNVFGVTSELSRLQSEGNYSASLMAVSDFVQGDTTYQTGPLVFSREVYEAKTMHRIADGEALKEGVSYFFRVVYDESLAVAAGAEWGDVGMSVRSETTGESKAVTGFVWYGAEEFLTVDQYNPRAVEFTFTPSTEGYSVVTFVPEKLVGTASRLKAADFHARTETGPAPTPVPTPAPTAAPTEEPTAVPTATATATATAAPTAVPTPAPTATPVPAPMTPKATLAVLFNADDNAPLTRGILAQTLWILAGQPEADNEMLFADQPADIDYAQALLWVSRTGVIPGENGFFGVNDPVSREQAALILYRYAALRGRSTQAAGDLSGWSDGADVSADARAAVIWALDRQLMGARKDGLLHPADTVLCGEAISMIAAFQQGL